MSGSRAVQVDVEVVGAPRASPLVGNPQNARAHVRPRQPLRKRHSLHGEWCSWGQDGTFQQFFLHGNLCSGTPEHAWAKQGQEVLRGPGQASGSVSSGGFCCVQGRRTLHISGDTARFLSKKLAVAWMF